MNAPLPLLPTALDRLTNAFPGNLPSLRYANRMEGREGSVLVFLSYIHLPVSNSLNFEAVVSILAKFVMATLGVASDPRQTVSHTGQAESSVQQSHIRHILSSDP